VASQRWILSAARRALVAGLAGALAIAACSDDGGGSGDDAAGSGATAGPEDGTGGPLARYADYESANYSDPSHWLCRPGADDACGGDLTATVVEAGGTTEVEEFVPADDPPIDCFYVYPTISRDETTYSDWEASPEEEGYVVLHQAARLASTCRVFAPIYRQRTLTALLASLGGSDPPGGQGGDPFADVLDAFRTYMAEDNHGRGFVLVGHSQGARMVNELIRTEIDPHEDVRERLVAAYIAGAAVAVPEGAVVGGDFQNVPLCTAPDETGCVLTWATFRSTAPPPPTSSFGRPRDGEGVAGCVNPAAVGGESAELTPYFPADASAPILSTLGVGGGSAGWLQGTDITTPFVTLPGLVSGKCASQGAFNYLSVTVNADPSDPRADDIGGDLTPEWGLHLIDVSIVMGDIVERVRDQAAAYTG
jgi:Protein of unknown function (DUF3089)